MPPYRKPDIKELLRKHSARIESQIKNEESNSKVSYSREYSTFKGEMAPELSRYEKWAHILGGLIRLKISKKDEDKIRRNLSVAHIDIEPWQVVTLSLMSFLGVFFLGLLVSFAVVLIKGNFSSFPFLFFFLIFVLSFFLFYYMNNYPQKLANKWKLKASSQMVPAILYIVVYMRHTPNLEKAISFASNHLQYPLALDFKKIFYDVEVGRFSTIKESVDNYLELWRLDVPEFVEAFHLIEGSLFEPDNSRRIASLEKSLQVVLDGVYDKMLKFSHNARSPLTNVYMLGVVLPTLALALLPLASAMIGEILRWYHVFIFFVLIVPFMVYYLTNKVLELRPGGYGESNLIEKNPLYSTYKSNKPFVNSFLICLPFFIIGLLPLIFQYTPFPSWLGLQNDYTFAEIGLSVFGNEKVFGFISSGTSVTGPFGAGALICSFFIPLGLALFFSLSYKKKTSKMIFEREKTKALEKEFNNSLFQLGNRIGNGTPPELVFGRVAESARGLKTEDFFKRVNYNVSRMGMGVEKAIFDKKRGAIIYYPSDLIATSMRVLIESSKKGLKIAAVSLMSISEYVKNIQKITTRLRDLLAEIISDMKSNMTFLAPLLSGIVIGLAMMITSILSKLNLADLSSDTSTLGSFSSLLSIFDMTQMIPPYFLQITVGIYLVEIIFILTSTLVSIDSGEDKLQRTYKTGKNLNRGVLLYFMVGFIATVVLFILSSVVIGGLS